VPACANANKPIGCYVFSGPTGVGKTEVAKQLASSLGH
jgi:ATP-dependent Clp protease ATP-binding subunit ClpA